LISTESNDLEPRIVTAILPNFTASFMYVKLNETRFTESVCNENSAQRFNFMKLYDL